MASNCFTAYNNYHSTFVNVNNSTHLGDVGGGLLVPGDLGPAVVVDVPLDVGVHDDHVELLRHVRHGVVGLVEVLLLQRVQDAVAPVVVGRKLPVDVISNRVDTRGPGVLCRSQKILKFARG